ncbi:hypothetical protein BD560DRAFT_410588 [Blakeslea trispora]|nr:hypothetical protein BD560DRAFT_410588 [Blakeslea trispora]
MFFLFLLFNMSSQKSQVVYPNVPLEFPCLACSFVADDPAQILGHYQKYHDFKVDEHALPMQTRTQYACPLCLVCMEPSPNVLYAHYQNEHDLTMLIEGDKVKEDISKRKQRQAEQREQEKEIPRVIPQQEVDELEEEEEQEKSEQEAPSPAEKHESTEEEAIRKFNELAQMFSTFIKAKQF